MREALRSSMLSQNARRAAQRRDESCWNLCRIAEVQNCRILSVIARIAQFRSPGKFLLACGAGL
jgi:hypothetical protein